jgi:hypothetical protein
MGAFFVRGQSARKRLWPGGAHGMAMDHHLRLRCRLSSSQCQACLPAADQLQIDRGEQFGVE